MFMKRDEIGYCICVLVNKTWGRTVVGNRIRSKLWWEARKKELSDEYLKFIENAPPIDPNHVPGIYNRDGSFQENPMPFEQEMGWSEDTSSYWLQWLQKAFRNRYGQYQR
jgi:hypothetical protein